MLPILLFSHQHLEPMFKIKQSGKAVKLSVCIPLYNTESLLFNCLQSVASQDFDDFEIILVNDGSSGLSEEGDSASKIVKKIKKACKVPVKYIEHKNNLGLLEARRTAVESASGQYICIVDSDDMLLPGALQSLYQQALESDADIIQGGADVMTRSQIQNQHQKVRLEEFKKRANNYPCQSLLNKSIFDNYLVKQNMTGFLWGKLIRRELYLEALSFIPFSHCVYAEDFLQFFFISYFAKKYIGIKNKVYSYTVDTGISASEKITDLKRWKKICSTAEVFTIIFSVLEELPGDPLTLEEMEALRLMSRSYLVDNIRHLQNAVIPELQPTARQMLCDYWGESFVETMEKAMKENKN